MGETAIFMKFHQKQLGRGVVIGMCVMLCGCVQTPSQRMPAVFELPVDKMALSTAPLVNWSNYQTFGLVMLSDSTGPEAALAISSVLLSTLSQRIQGYLERHCTVSGLIHLPVDRRHEGSRLLSILNEAKEYQVEALIVALFSSTESTHADTFGEERMMTQMPGTTTLNVALVELGLVDVEQGTLALYIDKTAVKSLDRLTVPIGHDRGTLEEALNILRANAGQQALDDALHDFTRGCVSG